MIKASEVIKDAIRISSNFRDTQRHRFFELQLQAAKYISADDIVFIKFSCENAIRKCKISQPSIFDSTFWNIIFLLGITLETHDQIDIEVQLYKGASKLSNCIEQRVDGYIRLSNIYDHIPNNEQLSNECIECAEKIIEEEISTSTKKTLKARLNYKVAQNKCNIYVGTDITEKLFTKVISLPITDTLMCVESKLMLCKKKILGRE